MPAKVAIKRRSSQLYQRIHFVVHIRPSRLAGCVIKIDPVVPFHFMVIDLAHSRPGKERHDRLFQRLKIFFVAAIKFWIGMPLV